MLGLLVIVRALFNMSLVGRAMKTADRAINAMDEFVEINDLRQQNAVLFNMALRTLPEELVGVETAKKSE